MCISASDLIVTCTYHNYNFSDISGSGPKGIVKSDILSHISKKNLQPIELEAPKKAAEANSAPPKSVAKPRYFISPYLYYRVSAHDFTREQGDSFRSCFYWFSFLQIP